jgi:hypothetical protein
LLCRAAFLVSVDSDTQVAEYILTGKKEMNFLAPTDQANAWDLYERGPRLFLYPVSTYSKQDQFQGLCAVVWFCLKI